MINTTAYGYDIDAPSIAPTVVTGTVGSNTMIAGTYSYKYTFKTLFGETTASPTSAVVTNIVGSILISNIVVLNNHATKRIYRTSVGNISPFRLVAEIDANSSVFIDTIADASLGAIEPVANYASSVQTIYGWLRKSKPTVHSQDNITATGSTWETALACGQQAEYVFVNTPVDNNGVLLPNIAPELIGLKIIIHNISNVNFLKVYGYEALTQIDSAGISTPFIVQPNTSVGFIINTLTNWLSVNISGGTGGGTPSGSATNDLYGNYPNPGVKSFQSGISLNGNVISNNIGIGVGSIAGITSGISNLAFGLNSGSLITTGISNITIGSGANTIAGSDNAVVVGQSSLGATNATIIGSGSSAGGNAGAVVIGNAITAGNSGTFIKHSSSILGDTMAAVAFRNGTSELVEASTPFGGASSVDYCFAYDTTTQIIDGITWLPNVFRNITFSNNGQISNWTHTPLSDVFTCATTGVYYIIASFHIELISGNHIDIITRFAKNGVEIVGSFMGTHLHLSSTHVQNLETICISPINAGQTLSIQMAAEATDVSISPHTYTLGSTSTSAKILIVRIA